MCTDLSPFIRQETKKVQWNQQVFSCYQDMHFFLCVKHNLPWSSLSQDVSELQGSAKIGPGNLVIHWTSRHLHCLSIIFHLCSLSSSNLLSCKAIFGIISLWTIQLFLYGQHYINLSLSALQWYPQRISYSQMHSKDEIHVFGFTLLKCHSHRLWHFADIISETLSRENIKKKKRKPIKQPHRKQLFLCSRATIWALRKYWAKSPYGRHTPQQSISVNTSQLVPSVLGMEIISWPSYSVWSATSFTLRQTMSLHLFCLLASM